MPPVLFSELAGYRQTDRYQDRNAIARQMPWATRNLTLSAQARISSVARVAVFTRNDAKIHTRQAAVYHIPRTYSRTLNAPP